MDRFGIEESWELDALDPNTIVDLVDKTIYGIVDMSKWIDLHQLQEEHRNQLQIVSSKWKDVVDLL